LKRTPGSKSKSKRTPGKENKIERESKERQEEESRSLPDTSTCVENKSQNEKIEARSAISTPSKAFATPSKGSASVYKTKTPLAKYLQDAKQVFRRCSTPSKLVGRNSERQIITDFIMENINNSQSGKNKNHSGALYISGLPGTGKSALVNEILQSESFSAKPSKKKPIFAFINCMTVTAKTIFKHLVKEFGLEDDTQEDLITLQKFVTHLGPAV
jgi:cell division control protein 6